MKTIIFTLLFSYSLTFVGQNNFVWNVADSTTKTKNEIYSATKLFIATYWKSAQAVIQNDDKDGGIILIKAMQKESAKTFFGIYYYNYYYSITFKIKENKFKIILDNVYCDKAYNYEYKPISCINPLDYKDYSSTNISPSQEKVDALIKKLETDLYLIVIDFLQEMKAAKIQKDDW